MNPVLPPPPLPPEAGPGPEPVPGQPFLDRGERHTARWRELVLVGAIGFFANIAARTSIASTAAMVTVALVAALLLGGRRIERQAPVALVALSLLLAPWLFARSSAGLTWFTALTIFSLCATAAALSKQGQLFDLKFTALVGHHAAMAIEWIYALPMVKRRVSRSDNALLGAIRGLVVAAPIVLVLALLLASADAVFAELLGLDSDFTSLLSHGFTSAVLAVFALGFMSRAAHTSPGFAPARGPHLGSTEVITVLVSILVLFIAFVATQLVMLFDGADHIIETVGLTRAEYARTGFFQLLWVATLTLLVLGTLRFSSREHRGSASRRFSMLAIAVLALTLAITLVSVMRLLLYVEAFGLTPLRFWSLAAAGGIGLVVVLYAVSVAGWRRTTSWFPGAALVLTAAFALGMNVVNPDARVASYNLSHTPAGATTDLALVAQLSDDAIPEAVARLEQMPVDQRGAFTRLLCARFDLEPSFGPLGSNRARTTADRLLDTLCETRVERPETPGWDNRD